MTWLFYGVVALAVAKLISDSKKQGKPQRKRARMRRPPVDDAYRVLGVEPSATDDEVRRAYRSMALQWHPDRFGDEAEAKRAEARLKELNAAYARIQQLRAYS